MPLYDWKITDVGYIWISTGSIGQQDDTECIHNY
jgi:hypothetical protein